MAATALAALVPVALVPVALVASPAASGTTSGSVYGPNGRQFTVAFPTTPRCKANVTHIVGDYVCFDSKSPLANPVSDRAPAPPTYAVYTLALSSASEVDKALGRERETLGLKPVRDGGLSGYGWLGSEKDLPDTKSSTISDPNATVDLFTAGRGTSAYQVLAVTSTRSPAKAFVDSFRLVGRRSPSRSVSAFVDVRKDMLPVPAGWVKANQSSTACSRTRCQLNIEADNPLKEPSVTEELVEWPSVAYATATWQTAPKTVVPPASTLEAIHATFRRIDIGHWGAHTIAWKETSSVLVEYIVVIQKEQFVVEVVYGDAPADATAIRAVHWIDAATRRIS